MARTDLHEQPKRPSAITKRLGQSRHAYSFADRTISLLFYSNEASEPAHIHVQRDRALAKFWLDPVALARSRNFSAQELRVMRQHVEENVTILKEAFDAHLGR